MIDYATCKSIKTSGVLTNYNTSIEYNILNSETTFNLPKVNNNKSWHPIYIIDDKAKIEYKDANEN